MPSSPTRRLLALLAACVALCAAAPAASADVQARAGTAGYCPSGTGVTVVVDFQELGGSTQIRCAPGSPATGVAALQGAGFTIEGTKRWGLSFICRIEGKPGSDTEPCVDTPPASAYWGYWHASNGGSWTYSEQGAANRKPPAGSFEGWSFSKNRTSTTNPPPRVTPKRPAAATAPGTAQRPAAQAPHHSPAAATPSAPPAVTTRQYAAPRSAFAAQGVAAGRWLANEVVHGQLEGPGGPGFPDWGLSIDTLLLLRASGADQTTATEIADALAEHGHGYYQFDVDGGKQATIAGAAAKALTAAVAAGRDAANFGGTDLRRVVTATINEDNTSKDYGRVSDQHTGSDNSNTFGQSFAVIGMSGSGDAPQETVDYLIRQQCPSGGFRLSGDYGKGTPSCDPGSDVLDSDSTAMAVQALLAAGDDGVPGAAAAAAKGARWLVGTQKRDGSFGGSGPTSASNSNSTGLAGEALAAAGEQAAADRAAKWLRGYQLTAASAGKAARDTGAIAYNAAALDSAKKSGIDAAQRDQWRRATAQAGLAFTGVRLGESGPDAGPNPGGGTDPAPPPGKDPGWTGGPGGNDNGTGNGTGTGNPAGAGTVPAAHQSSGTGDLASTGVAVFWPLVTGAGLLVAGTGALLLARRRRVR